MQTHLPRWPIFLAMALCLFVLPKNLAADESSQSSIAQLQEQQPAIRRVGGTYRVASIEKIADQDFRITFENPAGTKHRTLLLISDHVHIGVKQGQMLRLSAEILRETKEVTEISQVLLFLPGQQGATPVWMLSKHSNLELRGARYLEMHAPSSDYILF